LPSYQHKKAGYFDHCGTGPCLQGTPVRAYNVKAGDRVVTAQVVKIEFRNF